MEGETNTKRIWRGERQGGDAVYDIKYHLMKTIRMDKILYFRFEVTVLKDTFEIVLILYHRLSFQKIISK